jgi:hypothetical protein
MKPLRQTVDDLLATGLAHPLIASQLREATERFIASTQEKAMPDDQKSEDKLHEIATKERAADWQLDEKTSERNLRLWRQNEATDPAHTKPVTFGRKFTAIDGYYQLKRATETFGPVGIGWGWTTDEETIKADLPGGPVAIAKCKLSLWYRLPGNGNKVHTVGPVIGMNQLISPKGAIDDEAFKKATTDAITKALSYLGFSADVFMGLYDDSKYVAKLRDESNRKISQTVAKLPELLVKAVDGLPRIHDLKELDISWKMLTPELKALAPAQLDYMKLRFANRKRELAPAEVPEGEGDHRTGDPHNAP